MSATTTTITKTKTKPKILTLTWEITATYSEPPVPVKEKSKKKNHSSSPYSSQFYDNTPSSNLSTTDFPPLPSPSRTTSPSSSFRSNLKRPPIDNPHQRKKSYTPPIPTKKLSEPKEPLEQEPKQPKQPANLQPKTPSKKHKKKSKQPREISFPTRASYLKFKKFDPHLLSKRQRAPFDLAWTEASRFLPNIEYWRMLEKPPFGHRDLLRGLHQMQAPYRPLGSASVVFPARVAV